ncbi:MAG: TPM domain-containing protein [Pseudomonadales bacterium]
MPDRGPWPGPARRAAGLLIIALLSVAALAPGAGVAATAAAYPDLSGRVVDAADILSPSTERTLTAELEDFERESRGTQVVVATVPSLEGRAIEDYGYQLGRHWGIGQAGTDSGALLIIAPAERQVRIEVGYGLEGQLTDAVSWDIIQGRILPEFREGDFNAGVAAGTRGILAALDGSYEPSTVRADPGERRRLPAIVFWIIVGLIILSSFGRGGGGVGRALLVGGMLGGGRGAFGGGGFGGGGGGGFSGGGGSFGGGGASGGW